MCQIIGHRRSALFLLSPLWPQENVVDPMSIIRETEFSNAAAERSTFKTFNFASWSKVEIVEVRLDPSDFVRTGTYLA